MVKYDPLLTENLNTFALIVLDSSLAYLVERTSHSLASKMRCVALLEIKPLVSYKREEI